MRAFNITEFCRELRKRETPSEKTLWAHLKGRQFSAYKFRRQHPFSYHRQQGVVKFFIADFYCAEKKLIIELDGPVHDFQKDYDANRDEVLAQLGLKTLHIKNSELDKDLKAVLNKIKAALL